MDRMCRLLRPTLGPIARRVAVARDGPHEPPEVLDDAATIARRTIQLADPFEDMGGMIVRHLVWRVHETAGDGAATAAVLAQALVREAGVALAAGANPVPLRRGVEGGLAVAQAELRRRARTVAEPAEIAGLVLGIVQRPELAAMIGEIFDSVGPEGSVLVEPAPGARTDHAYLEGIEWAQGYVSPFLLRDGQTRAGLAEPYILVTDQAVEKAEQLVPALEACVGAGCKSLLVVAPDVRDQAVALLIVNRQRGTVDDAVAVKAPLLGPYTTPALEDIAAVTGGRCVLQSLGERLEQVTPADLGRAREAWATANAFGILGGRGDRAQIRHRLAEARAELNRPGVTTYDRAKLSDRIGRLAGAAAVIRVGAPTTAERDELKPRLEAAVRAARSAVQHGCVPGGGAALLACAPALEELATAGDESLGIAILARALAEPMRAIARNAGLDPAPILHEARRRGPDWTFDAVRREWVEAWSAGLLDPLAVVLASLDAGVSAGTTALTADVLVRRRQPPVEITP